MSGLSLAFAQNVPQAVEVDWVSSLTQKLQNAVRSSNTSTPRKKESSNAEHRIQRPSGPADTGRRRLGDHQYLAELRFQREEAALDTRGAAAAAARVDPVVFPRAAGQPDVERGQARAT